ncbi:MAG: O-succinylhomoserine sulfhydrylase [Rhodospirillaceae bacterium]|nr:O-succinylhomoserine sulfhydrylase [Alphaproteobacteria bacterium]MBR71558.1 O-succinylhomoserine sulfhydrylase [Rhodospirillaceae bacterium]|tara:strand:+ start:1081 stop:2280 length:1200 start_codon:yes stop_codon:yes gene_type:complete
MGDDKSNCKNNWGLATRAVRSGLDRSKFGETAEAIYATSGFVYETAELAEARFSGESEGFVYSRFGNPTVRVFENRLASIEGAEDCRATASGMSAVFASLMCQLKSGDHVVSSRSLFGSCHYIITELLPKYGIEVTLVDGRSLDEWQSALKKNTKCIFFESPSNPTLEIVDICTLSDIAHSIGAKVIIDNVFSSPALQQPLELGADIVVYSTTKHIDGQGRCLGGAILSSEKWISDQLVPFYRNTGPTMSPFNAWVMTKGLETLHLRVKYMCESAQKIAYFLSNSTNVQSVIYPGLETHPQYNLAKKQMSNSGTVVSFEIEGGRKEAFKVLNELKIIDISNNLGDSKSLITHPATTTHQRLSEDNRIQLGISDSLVRLSVGLEDTDDLIVDLRQAINSL